MIRSALRLVLVGALASACAARSDQVRDRGMEPTRTTAFELDEALQPRRYAIAIGVDDYDDPGIPDLKLAVVDARAIGDRFGADGHFDDIRTLTSGPVTTRSTIFRSLKEVASQLRREDTLVVYFSGHGTRVQDEGTWRRFLMVSDTVSGDLEGTAIDLQALQRWFSRLPPSRKVLIVDACFNGDGRSAVRPGSSEAQGVADGALTPEAATLSAGEAHLMATTAGRPARESDSLGHGVYTFHLLDAMSWGFKSADKDQDGVVTAFEAHDHARESVIKFTGGVQVPEAVFRVVGTNDVVLAGDIEKRQRREDALVYFYASEDPDLGESVVVVDGRERGMLPGSVMVPSGRHLVELSSRSGEGTISGRVRLAPGKTYRADSLARTLGGPSRQVYTRAVVNWVPRNDRPRWTRFTGPEVGVRLRLAQASPRGLYVHTGIGGGTHDLEVPTRRGAGWFSLGAGWQKDASVFRLGLGTHLGIAFVPLAENTKPIDHHGWVFPGLGPEASLGFVLGRDWALMATGRSLVGVRGAREPALVGPVVQPAFGLGVEMAF